MENVNIPREILGLINKTEYISREYQLELVYLLGAINNQMCALIDNYDLPVEAITIVYQTQYLIEILDEKLSIDDFEWLGYVRDMLNNKAKAA